VDIHRGEHTRLTLLHPPCPVGSQCRASHCVAARRLWYSTRHVWRLDLVWRRSHPRSLMTRTQPVWNWRRLRNRNSQRSLMSHSNRTPRSLNRDHRHRPSWMCHLKAHHLKIHLTEMMETIRMQAACTVVTAVAANGAHQTAARDRYASAHSIRLR
jgi:hypothetical protein